MFWTDNHIGFLWFLTLLALGIFLWIAKVPLLRIFQPESPAGWVAQCGATVLMMAGAIAKMSNPPPVGQFTPLDLAPLPLIFFIWFRMLYLALMRRGEA